MDEASFELQPTPPYNFDLQWKSSSEEPQPEIYKDGIWRRAFKIGDRSVPVKITSVGTVEKPKLRVNASSDAKEKKHLADKIADIFRLRDDLRELYNFMDKDEILLEIKNKV